MDKNVERSNVGHTSTTLRTALKKVKSKALAMDEIGLMLMEEVKEILPGSSKVCLLRRKIKSEYVYL